MENNRPKINNRTLIILLVILIIVITGWLIGYFTGIDKNNTLLQKNVMQNQNMPAGQQKAIELPALPKLPEISEKSVAGETLPPLPKLP